MATTTTAIEMRNFDLIGILDDEQDCLESFKEHSGYVCDAISEVADSYIPIYNSDVWKNASDIQEHIEEAIAQGLAPTEGGTDIDLVKIFQAGYYQYYTQSLYNNLDTLAFNYIADKVNEALNQLNEATVEAIDIEAIEDEIENETDGYDNNNRFDDLEDTAQSIIERINEGVFAK
jgi:hypothetical protein